MFILFYSCTPTAQSRVYDRPPSEPGKCYAKVLVPDQYDIYTRELMLYTGSNFDQEGVVKEVTPGIPKTTKWVKKKADKNCLSSNPDDCLVWCLQEVPAVEGSEYYIVTDTSLVKEFRIENIELKELVATGGFTEWREVLCEKDITHDFKVKLLSSLRSRAYEVPSSPDKNKINPQTKAALIKFQTDNYLPKGQLDIETLKALGL